MGLPWFSSSWAMVRGEEGDEGERTRKAAAVMGSLSGMSSVNM